MGRWKRKLNTIRDFPEDVSYLFDLQRTFYQTYIQARWERLLFPAYEQAAGQTDIMESVPRRSAFQDT